MQYAQFFLSIRNPLSKVSQAKISQDAYLQIISTLLRGGRERGVGVVRGVDGCAEMMCRVDAVFWLSLLPTRLPRGRMDGMRNCKLVMESLGVVMNICGRRCLS